MRRRLAERIGMVLGALALMVADGWAQSPGLTLHLTTNQTVFGPGTTLTADAGVTYGGPPITVDILFGAILPDGDAAVAFGPGMQSATARVSRPSALPALYRGLPLASGLDIVVPDLLRYTFTGAEGYGTYRVFLAAVRPGAFGDDRIDAGDVLAVQFADIVLRPAATVVVDASRAGTAVVPPTGGTVTATGADGTVYTLQVPDGALTQPTTITLTPVTSLTGLAIDTSRHYAVRAAPEGLTFAVPATLLVQPGDATPSVGWVGLSTRSDGAGLALVPAGGANGAVLLGLVEHFSILGVAIPATVQQIPNGPSQASYVARMSAAQAAGDRTAQDAILREWLQVLVEPLLRSGQNDPAALFQGLREYVAWDYHRISVLWDDSVLTAEASATETLMADSLRATMARAIGTCLASPSVAGAEDILRLQNLAWTTFRFLTFAHAVPDFMLAPIPVHADLRDLDLASVLPQLCARIEIASTTFPGAVQVGVPTTMTVQAGWRLTNGQGVAAPPLQVAIDATGATPTTRVGLTNAAATFSTTFTPSSGNLAFAITATIVDLANFPYLSAVPLVATAHLTRTSGGVVVTPSQTTIAPGQSRQFTANQSVTWAVSGGGTITNAGLFTSNSTQGTFFVTATSVVDPTQVGIAQVTVSVPSTGDLQIRITGTRATGTATLNGVATSVNRPLAEAQVAINELLAIVAPAASLTEVGVIVEAPVSVTVNLPGTRVTGSLVVSVPWWANTRECVVTTPGLPVVRVALGTVDGRVSGTACSGVVTVDADGVGTAQIAHVSGDALVQVSAASASEATVTECRGGRAVLQVPAVRRLRLQGLDACQFALQGGISGSAAGNAVPGIVFVDVINSSLGTIQAGTIPLLDMRQVRDTTLSLQVSSLAAATPSTVALNVELCSFPLPSLSVGSISGAVRILANARFSNADVVAWLDGIGHSGPRNINGNNPGS